MIDSRRGSTESEIVIYPRSQVSIYHNQDILDFVSFTDKIAFQPKRNEMLACHNLLHRTNENKQVPQSLWRRHIYSGK